MTAIQADAAPARDDDDEPDYARTPDRALMAQTARFCWGYWRRTPALFWAVLGFVLLATAIDVLIPLFAGRMVDAVAAGAPLATAHAELAAILVLGVLLAASRQAVFRVLTYLTLRAMRAITAESFARVQRFSADWHANSFAGATVRKITRGIWALDTLSDTLLLGLIPAAIVLAGVTLVLGLHWPVLGLTVALGSLLYVAVTVGLSVFYIAPRMAQAAARDTRLGAALADAITCNAVVKSFGTERREDERLAGVLEDWRARTRDAWLRSTDVGGLQSAMNLALQGLILAMTLGLWAQSRATAGDVTFVLTSWFLIAGYLREIGMHVRNLQRSVNDMEDVMRFLERAPQVADHAEATPLLVANDGPARGRITFDRVTFRYANQPEPTYRDFSIDISPGEVIGLCGPSGAGKSTFVKLIQRLYDLEAGAIRIDGQDVARVTQESLRQAIALVPQEPALFHRSLAENIAYGRPGASRAEIEAAAREAHAHEFIGRLPMGYETMVGERGIKLSGGERQRVAIARAILADRPILIFDEATSSLDSESERLIQLALERLMAGRTTILIAHRLSTLRQVDRILVFERGRIVEQGGHEELLLREGGRYRRLWDLQADGLLDHAA